MSIFNQTNVTDLSTSILPHHRSGPETEDWGPRRDALAIVLPITVIYILTFIGGAVGNVSTCVVIARNRSMHTATNYYLFSLAVSDLLLLLTGLPTEIYAVWKKYPYPFGEPVCIVQGLAAETSANATVLTITAFTVERYIAICRPFIAHSLSEPKRAVRCVAVVWALALCLAAPPAAGFGLVCAVKAAFDAEGYHWQLDPDKCQCNVKREIVPHAFEISTCVFFVAPMSLITVLYALIALRLRRAVPKKRALNGQISGGSVRLRHRTASVRMASSPSQRGKIKDMEIQDPGQDDDGRKNYPSGNNMQASRRVVRMLVAVVVAFFVCWAPFHAQRLLAMHGEPTSLGTRRAYKALTYISGVLYFVSTAINPLLYNIMSRKFRQAFQDTFRRCCYRRVERQTAERCGDVGCAASRRYSTLQDRSGKSSQVNSNTDSGVQCCVQRQDSMPLLDYDAARDAAAVSRRPLIVSFRKKAALPKDVAVNGEDKETKTEISILESKNSYKEFALSEHDLEPTHICPLGKRTVTRKNKKLRPRKIEKSVKKSRTLPNFPIKPEISNESAVEETE